MSGVKQGRSHGESKGANSACDFVHFAHAACHWFNSGTLLCIPKFVLKLKIFFLSFPKWFSCAKYIRKNADNGRFNLNNILNNFSDKKQKKIFFKLKKNFSNKNLSFHCLMTKNVENWNLKIENWNWKLKTGNWKLKIEIWKLKIEIEN